MYIKYFIMIYSVLLVILCIVQVRGADDKVCEQKAPLTSPAIGRKAWDKCVEYQQLLKPCEKGACGQADDDLDEFVRHFALLGKLEGSADWRNRWLCGGTLISEKFILTSGRCLVWRLSGFLMHAVLGTRRRSDGDVDLSNRYNINQRFYPKDFHSNFYYHDIGLVETKEVMKLSQSIVPACLHVGDFAEDDTAYSIGWGSTKHWTSTNDDYKKITLKKATVQECSLNNPPNDLNGNADINETVQICYGNKDTPENYCMGTSGSPLQVKNKNLNCMYTVIGVTSSSDGCVYGAPGIYFRVSYYLSWIESVVWP